MRPRETDIRSSLIHAATVALAILAVVLFARTLYQNRDRYQKVDFTEYSAWSTELRMGGNPWRPETTPGLPHLGNCNYTPTFLYMFAPITGMRPVVGYWVWQSILIASLLLATTALAREIWPSNAWAQILAVSLAFVFPETFGAQYESQPTFLLLLMIVGCWILDRRERPIAAGALLAFAALLKFYPALAGIYFLLRRRWTTLAAIAGFGIAGLVASNPYHLYELFRYGVPIFTQHFWLTQDRLIAVLGNAFYYGERFLWPTTITLCVAAVASAIVAAAAIFATHRASQDPADESMRLGIWLAAALLLSPLAWGHELPYLFPLYFGIGARWREFLSSKPVAFGVFVLAMAAVITGYFSSPIRSMHIFFWGTLIAYFAACRLAAAESAATQPSAQPLPISDSA